MRTGFSLTFAEDSVTALRLKLAKAEAERDEAAKLSHEYRNERDALRALLDSCVICDREPVGVFTYSPPDFSVGISSGIWEELADGYDGTPLYRAIPKEQS